jgi:integrase
VAWIKERKTKSGETHYKVVVRLKGYPTQTATFHRKTDAKIWGQNTESAMREGRHFKAAESKKRTFSDTIDHYLKTVVPIRYANGRYKNSIICHLVYWKHHLGPYTLADVTPAKIAELRDTLLVAPINDSNGNTVIDKNGKPKRNKSPATVVRYLASLSTFYSTVVNEWGWVDQNPVKKVKRPTEPRGRVRFLSDDERSTLLKACRHSKNKYLYPIVVLALSTGARQGEILSIKWDQVDFERSSIRLDQTKNNERRALPLVGHAHDVVKELYNDGIPANNLVFPRPDGKKPVYIVNDWEKALIDSGIKNFRFHDLRHCAASYLAMNGATLAEISEILGHKTLQMVKRYAHLSEQHTSQVVSKMNDKIFEDIS